ncbi:MAG: TolC family protein [Desulfobacteraceae bacterium]|nr:TolC family protein [Desulfobacteraceae bacterium]
MMPLMPLFLKILHKMARLGGAAALWLLLAFPAHAFTIQEMLAAAARQPGVAASELAAREGHLREQAAIAALFPRINAFGKAEFYNSPTNPRPMPPTEVNVQAGESIPFSYNLLRYGLTLDVPLFVKSLYDLKDKAALLAQKASLAYTLDLSSRKAAVVAANSGLAYLLGLDGAIDARLASLAKTSEDLALKVQSGRTAEVELLKVDNAINDLKAQKNDLAAKILDLRKDLETLTGLEVSEPAPMVLTRALAPAPFLGEKIAEEETAAAREEWQRSKSARYPGLFLSGSITGNEGEAYNTDEGFYRNYGFVGLTLQMPLFDQTLTTAQKIARTQLRKADKELAATRIALAAQEKDLKGKLPVIEESQAIAARSLANSKQILKVARLALETGRTTTEDYLLHEAQVLAARAALAQADNDRWRVISQLAVIYGADLQEVVQ